MSELLGLTVAEAAAKIASAEISAGEYFAAWHGAAAGDDLNAYLWQVEDPSNYEVPTAADLTAPPAAEIITLAG